LSESPTVRPFPAILAPAGPGLLFEPSAGDVYLYPHVPMITPPNPRESADARRKRRNRLAWADEPPRVFHCLDIPPEVGLDRVVYIGAVHDDVPAALLPRALPEYASPFRDPNVSPTESRAMYASYLAGCPGLLRAARRELTGMHLACWCAPQPCHGDVLRAACARAPRRREHPLARRPVGYRPPHL